MDIFCLIGIFIYKAFKNSKKHYFKIKIKLLLTLNIPWRPNRRRKPGAPEAPANSNPETGRAPTRGCGRKQPGCAQERAEPAPDPTRMRPRPPPDRTAARPRKPGPQSHRGGRQYSSGSGQGHMQNEHAAHTDAIWGKCLQHRAMSY